MGIINKFASLPLCLLFISASLTAASEFDSCEPCYDCNLSKCCFEGYVGHTEGRWLDNRQGYTTLGIFSQLACTRPCSFVPFIDLRGHVFNDGKLAANAGGGFRYFGRDDKVFGINAFYDYREAYWYSRFREVGLGVEMLSRTWEFHLNGYLPIGRKTGHSSIHHLDLTGGFFATKQKHRRAYAGADVEIGRWIWERTCGCLDIYAGIGSYYYSTRQRKDQYGGELRVAAVFGPYFTLEGQGGYDRFDHGMGLVRAIFNIPFEKLWNPCQTDCCACDFTCRPVQRQEIIALTNNRCTFTWNWDDETGERR